MKLSHFFLYCFILFLLSNCENNTLTTLETTTAVVDGYLIAGQTVDSLRVTQSNSYSQNELALVTLDNLNITINDGKKEILLSPIGKGYYESMELIIETDQSYVLSFEHNGEQVSSETYVPSRKLISISSSDVAMEKVEATGGFGFPNFGDQPDPIDISWENPEGDYFYILIENIEDDPEDINELFAQFGVRFSFVTEPQIMDTYSINPMRELRQFGTHRIVVFRVNAEYVALYESAGSSSISISEPPNNIENGLGIFTGVSSDTVFLEVRRK